jgi:hypothetical protein
MGNNQSKRLQQRVTYKQAFTYEVGRECGERRVFQTEKQKMLWSKLHGKKCEICKEANLPTLPTLKVENPKNYAHL